MNLRASSETRCSKCRCRHDGMAGSLATTIEEMDGLVKNLKAVIHHDVVCP